MRSIKCHFKVFLALLFFVPPPPFFTRVAKLSPCSPTGLRGKPQPERELTFPRYSRTLGWRDRLAQTPHWVWGRQTVRLWQAQSGNHRTLWSRLRVNWRATRLLYRTPRSWEGPAGTSWGPEPWTARRRGAWVRRRVGSGAGADAEWGNSWRWSGSCSWPNVREGAFWLRCLHLRMWTGTWWLHSCTRWNRRDIFPAQKDRCLRQLQKTQKSRFLVRIPKCAFHFKRSSISKAELACAAGLLNTSTRREKRTAVRETGRKRYSPVIWALWRFRRCFTVISRMSAFSSLECLELWREGKEHNVRITHSLSRCLTQGILQIYF